MQTFDCPKCGAPVSYEPNAFGSGNIKCAYCQSQLALPHHGQPARIISQIDINVGPHVAATAKKAAWVMVLIPLLIVVLIVGGVLAGVFGALAPLMKSTNRATTAGRAPSSSKSGDPANAFAREVQKFGSEGIGPGMMTDARSIGVDGNGNIYVGEYLGGRVQVFDANGKFLGKWTGIGNPWGLAYVSKENAIYMCDGFNNRVIKLGLDGTVQGVLGSQGRIPGKFDFVHNIAVDSEGSIYVVEIKNWRVQKFAK